jgi:hypothetical protein
MAHRSIKVQRVYKNTSGEILRVDTISVSGWVQRDKIHQLGEVDLKQVNGFNVRDYGDFKFHAHDGRKIDTEVYNTTTTRVVTEVEMIGGYTSVAPSPNYNSFTWQYGTVDVSDLPQVGDTV